MANPPKRKVNASRPHLLNPLLGAGALTATESFTAQISAQDNTSSKPIGPITRAIQKEVLRHRARGEERPPRLAHSGAGVGAQPAAGRKR